MGKQKRVFLYVSGEEYSAMNFDDKYNSQDFYEQMLEEGVTKKTIDEDDVYADVEIKEFAAIDEDFIDFIRNNFVDYDVSKDTDFFEVNPLKV